MTNLVEGPFDADRVRAMREVLTASGAGIYLAAHLAGPLPTESMAAARESDEMDLRVGRVGPDRAEDLLQRDREARAVLAAALQVSPDRLVLVHGAADGIRLVTLEAIRLDLEEVCCRWKRDKVGLRLASFTEPDLCHCTLSHQLQLFKLDHDLTCLSRIHSSASPLASLKWL